MFLVRFWMWSVLVILGDAITASSSLSWSNPTDSASSFNNTTTGRSSLSIRRSDAISESAKLHSSSLDETSSLSSPQSTSADVSSPSTPTTAFSQSGMELLFSRTGISSLSSTTNTASALSPSGNDIPSISGSKLTQSLHPGSVPTRSSEQSYSVASPLIKSYSNLSAPSLDTHLNKLLIVYHVNITQNQNGDVTFTVPQGFVNTLAPYLSRGDCPAFDPLPMIPIIGKRVTTPRNPCAVAKSKSGIAAIGGGTSLFRNLLNLPRNFPPLVPDLAADLEDINSYVRKNLRARGFVSIPQINAMIEFFYLLAYKHEEYPLESIQENTIPHSVIVESGDLPQHMTSSATMTSATATSTQSLSGACPSNTFLDPTPTAVPICCCDSKCNAAMGVETCGPGPYFHCPCRPLLSLEINNSTSPEQWDNQQSFLASFAAYTAPPDIITTSRPPAPTFSTCEPTGTNAMQLATATSAASAYCSAMATRVAGGATNIGACAVQNRDPPYKVSDAGGSLCPNQADIWFQMLVDSRGEACANATVPESFTLDNCIKGMMWSLSSSNYLKVVTGG